MNLQYAAHMHKSNQTQFAALILWQIWQVSIIHSTHTHTIILWLYGFCLGQPGEPVPKETFTHSHLSWSSIVPHLLHPPTTIHGILPVHP